MCIRDRTSCPKKWAKPQSKNEKKPLPVDVRRSKTSLLKFTNREFTQRRRRQQRERLKSKIFRQAKQHLCTYISLPSLHDYNVELPNFTFCRGREQKKQLSFSLPELWCSPLEFISKKFANIWRTERDGITAIQFEAAQIHLLNDVFVAVVVA